MQGVGTWGRLGHPDAEGRRPDRMSTQRLIQNSDLCLVRPVPPTHMAHQAQSEILEDVVRRARLRVETVRHRWVPRGGGGAVVW